MDIECYCEQVVKSTKSNGHNRIIEIDHSKGDEWVYANLYMDYNINNKRYGLFAEAVGEGSDGVYIGINFCPFCGRDLRNNQYSSR